MFERYKVCINVDGICICNTYFFNIDQVIKFVVRFDYSLCCISVDDVLFPDRFIDVSNLIDLWNSTRCENEH